MNALLCLIASVAVAGSQQPPAFQGGPVFDRLLAKSQAEHWTELPIGELMGRVGLELVGTPYVGFTAERWVDREVCSIDLTGLDCVTFYENCLAFARMLKRGGSRPDAMMDEVRLTRYRDGQLSDYASRVHYTSDWIYDNARKGTVLNLSPALPGAAAFTQRVGFMSKNPKYYKQLVRFPALRPVIAAQERAINERQTWFVPTAHVARAQHLLKTGDILGFTTAKMGLDTSHTGFVLVRDGKVGVLHASSSKRAIVFEPDLAEFVASFATGIMVARPIEPRRSFVQHSRHDACNCAGARHGGHAPKSSARPRFLHDRFARRSDGSGEACRA